MNLNSMVKEWGFNPDLNQLDRLKILKNFFLQLRHSMDNSFFVYSEYLQKYSFSVKSVQQHCKPEQVIQPL